MDPNNPACRPCRPSDCGNPFDRVVVSYLVAGGTHVFWDLRDDFTDPRPLTFQLEVGQSENPDADDWKPVGAPVVDTFLAVDGEQRVFGKVRWQYYRVRLDTQLGTYYSAPTGLTGTLDHRDWRLARATMRAEQAYMRAGDGQLGYLLKRRVAGDRCRSCTEPQTGEVTNIYCPECYGTGFRCGYFFPIGCVWADINPRTIHLTQDKSRGTVADVGVSARMLNTWALVEGDVFIHKTTDDRFHVHRVQNVIEFRGVPIVANVELRPAPATDPVYMLDVPHQVDDVARLKVRANAARP